MDTGQNPLVILKLGGSLLNLADLSERIVARLEQRPGIRPALIVGGGAAADVVRGWGDTFSLSEVVCHDLAIQSMSLTASLLTRIVPHTRMVRSWNEAEVCWTDGEWPVLQVADWLRGLALSPLPRGGGEGQGEGASVSQDSKPLTLALSPSRGEGTKPIPADSSGDHDGWELPQSWAVTSDSLSAWVADKWRADELWLLKSTDLPAEMSFATASQAGLVDAFFPQIASQIQRVFWCNLRADHPVLQLWPTWP